MINNTTEKALNDNKYITKEKFKSSECHYNEFMNIIHDLIEHPTVRRMKNFNQHANISCYQHCMQVAYYTYIICKQLHLDYVSATRGAMLHDLFLYDWHNHSYIRPNKKWNTLHAFSHPKVALKNAKEIFYLNAIEQDVILNHMWPVTIKIPHFKETVVVTFADKYSACRETFGYFRKLLHTKRVYKYAYVFLSLIVLRII